GASWRSRATHLCTNSSSTTLQSLAHHVTKSATTWSYLQTPAVELKGTGCGSHRIAAAVHPYRSWPAARTPARTRLGPRSVETGPGRTGPALRRDRDRSARFRGVATATRDGRGDAERAGRGGRGSLRRTGHRAPAHRWELARRLGRRRTGPRPRRRV